MLYFNLKIIWQVSYLLLFHKCEKWDKEMLKCLLNFIWLVRERRSQKILTPKLMMSEKLSGRTLNLHWSAHVILIHANASQVLKSVVVQHPRHISFHISPGLPVLLSVSLSPPTLPLSPHPAWTTTSWPKWKRKIHYPESLHKLQYASCLLFCQNHQRKRCS